MTAEQVTPAQDRLGNRAGGRLQVLFGRLALWLSWSYLAGLLGILAFLWFFGERSWLGLILLYLPRAPFALPLLVTVPLILISGSIYLLLTQLLCLLLVLFPLMGLQLRLEPQPSAEPPYIRVLSYNVWFATQGVEAIRAEVERAQPQVVLFQAANTQAFTVLQKEPFVHWHTLRVTRLAIASQFPILEYEVPRDGSLSGEPFARFTLDTPLGVIDLYSVHFVSPRGALDHLRQTRRQFHRWLPSDADRLAVSLDTQIRERQVRNLSEAVRRSAHPVLIAGDTNLPVLSRLEREYLSGFHDAFEDVGSGFGYTFPAIARFGPWMRIDRMFAGPQLRFLSLVVGGERGSDHCPIIAEVAAASH